MVEPNLRWYRTILKVYPRSYREEYQEEMIATLQDMFKRTTSSKQRVYLVIRTLNDFLLSLAQQMLTVAENSFNQAPYIVKRNMVISSGLVAPFFLIFSYNFLSLTFHKTILIASFESHAWIIYSIVLPIIGLSISLNTFVDDLYLKFIAHKWREVIRAIFKDWLFPGLFISALALVAIF